MRSVICDTPDETEAEETLRAGLNPLAVPVYVYVYLHLVILIDSIH